MLFGTSRFGEFLSLVLVGLLMINVIGQSAVFAQEASKQKRKLTVTQRFDKFLIKHPGENPFLVALIHAIERQLQNKPAESDIEKRLNGQLTAHPKVTRQMLQKAVQNWYALPQATRQKVTPVEMKNLTPAKPLDMNVYRKAVARVAKTKARGTRMTRPVSKMVMGAAVSSDKRKTSKTSVNPARFPEIVDFPKIKQVYGSSASSGPMKSPDGTPIIKKGTTFSIEAYDVPSKTNLIKVHFFDDDALKTTVVPKTVTASAAGPTKLIIAVPEALHLGHDYQVQLEVPGKGTSGKKWVQVWVLKLGLTQQISSIEPNSRYPGSKATLTGTLLAKDMTVVMDPYSEGFPDYALKSTVPSDGLKWIDGSHVEFTIPQFVVPGKYRLAFRIGKLSKLSNWIDFTVKAPKYRLEFTKIFCKDESDWESPGDDEIVTMWVGSADPNHAWTKYTGEYEGFHDAKTEPYKAEDKWLFLPDSNSAPVRKYLEVATQLWESDGGDAEDWQDAMDIVAGVAAGIGTAVGGWGAVAGGVVAAIAEGIGAFIVLLAAPSDLGMEVLAWDAPTLQEFTANNLMGEGQLTFNNDDDTGSYKLYYRVHREQP